MSYFNQVMNCTYLTIMLHKNYFLFLYSYTKAA
nr:MAG TPA: hypothetical protein [Caudoviricetes sp.]